MTHFHARILHIHANGETSSTVGDFESRNNALERARNDIEFQYGARDIVAALVLTTDPIAHYEAVVRDCSVCGAPTDRHLETCTRIGQHVRYRAEKAIGFKGEGL